MAAYPLHPRSVRGALVLIALAGSAAATPQREAFVEEAVLRGIDYLTDAPGTYGVGMGFFDLDGDGAPDVLLIGSSSLSVGLFENDGLGRFEDVRSGSGIPPIPLANGVSSADYDADGDLDVYITCEGFSNCLLRNEGGMTFTEQTLGAGVADVGYGQGCSWGDYDGDGWVDLYLANRDIYDELPNCLFRNRGDGTFEDVAPALGIQALEDPLTFQSSFVDYDGDGLQDLYLCTDKGEGCIYTQNLLFRNLGGTFQNVTAESGTAACVACMGTGIGDFDGNGAFDFYCTNTPFGNVLLLNDGDGTYTEMGVPAGVRSYRYGWGNMMFDYDNDGRLDLYVCNSDSPNRLYEQQAVWPCLDVAPELGVDDAGISYTTAVADLEGDGDLDVLLQNAGETIRLFVNKEGERRNWLQLRLVGREPNTYALGAKVRIVVDGVETVQEVRSGVGFKSESTKLLHFGLGDATQVERITVEWPFGARSVLQHVAAGQRLTIREARRSVWAEAQR